MSQHCNNYSRLKKWMMSQKLLKSQIPGRFLQAAMISTTSSSPINGIKTRLSAFVSF